MLHKHSSLLDVRTREQLETAVLRFAEELEFETVTATVAVDLPDGSTKFSCVNNAPSGYREIHDDLEFTKQDPVLKHCRSKHVPLAWNQATYVNAGQGERWEFQAQFGYATGIAYAMHMPNGLHFCLGVDRDKPLEAYSQHLNRMAADLQLFAVHAQEAAIRILTPHLVEDRDFPCLTPRELECLRWTMAGKTAWEVGHILGISEQTAVRHVFNASHKLGCSNKHQAVLRALRLGLIG